MTSRRLFDPHYSGWTGQIRVEPALSEDECVHLSALADADGTLRGTPTGRGDRDVPFARLQWEVCGGGCCLTWSSGLEESAVMAPTLQFLIDHLLRRGAKAEGRRGFDGFTFDHVLDGAIMGGELWDRELRLVEVVRNVVTERSLPRACDTVEASTPARTPDVTRRGKLPKNVIEFRPRRA